MAYEPAEYYGAEQFGRVGVEDRDGEVARRFKALGQGATAEERRAFEDSSLVPSPTLRLGLRLDF